MDKLWVTEIERSAIHDGEGIRTVVFLQGCPLHCFWCCNPETQPMHPVLLHDAKKCVGCRACVDVCEPKALSLVGKTVVVDRSRCNGCGACDPVCPVGANTLSGTEMDVEAVLRVVLRDRSYYERTGGGITISGGEPLLQSKPLSELLKRCKAEGISTLIETTANVPWESFLDVLPYTDAFFIDFKHPDAEPLKRGTGATLSLLWENLEKLTEKGVPFTLRTPVIYGFNEDRDVLKRCLQASVALGKKKHVLLPYHALGSGKYEKLGKEKPLSGHRSMDRTELEDLLPIAEEQGLSLEIGG